MFNPIESIDSTLRGATTQDLIIAAFVERLRGAISQYTDQNCFASDDPVPLSHAGGDEFCTVSFGDGSFPSEFFEGGGNETLVESGSVIISPSIKLSGDRKGRKSRRLYEDNEGKSLINRKRQILVALFGGTWEPRSGRQPLLRDMPSPRRATAPGEIIVGEAKYTQSRIIVDTVFDWDLTGVENA